MQDGLKAMVQALGERWKTMDKATKTTVAVALVDALLEAVAVQALADAKRREDYERDRDREEREGIRFAMQRMENLLQVVIGRKKPDEERL
jgi:hypothetical protein